MDTEQLTPEESAILNQTDEAPEAEIADEPVVQEEPEATPAEPEAAPAEPAPVAEAKPEPAKPPEGYVPHQAMHAERVKRQELEKRLADLEAANKAPEDLPPQFVDPIVDPEGYRKWAEHQASAPMSQIEQFQKQQAEVQKQAERTLKAQSYEAEFIAKQPDLPNGFNWLVERRKAQYAAQGYDEAQSAQMLQQEANRIYDGAQMLGKNPVEELYLLAQREGYSAAPAPAAAPTPTDQVTALAAAQQATAGVTGATGVPQEGKLSLKALADMPESEMAKLSEDDLRKVMGG